MFERHLILRFFHQGSLCCMCGDTFSSELGPVLGSKNNIISPTSDQVFHIIKFKRVPKGTNGGISLLGTLASFYGGLLVGLTYYLTLKVCLFVSGTNFGIRSGKFSNIMRCLILINFFLILSIRHSAMADYSYRGSQWSCWLINRFCSRRLFSIFRYNYQDF